MHSDNSKLNFKEHISFCPIKFNKYKNLHKKKKLPIFSTASLFLMLVSTFK